MLERRSALAGAISAGGRDGASGGRACRIGEAPPGRLVQAAGFAAGRAAFEKAVTSVLGKKPPTGLGKAVAAGDHLILRTGPEQLWFAGPDNSDLDRRLMAALPPGAGAVSDLSHSRTRLFIEGTPARDVLAGGIALDLHPQAFRAGQFALTGLHHTPILLYRPAAKRYEIWAMRSFALTVWEWLTDAALPMGYDISSG